ncbi:MAG: hypothetical protein M1838_002078 [Thelocarpon superellum]|nr:MAG: hypothetical protein M1838_002078 [Thelocarpon superellum]
MRANHILSPRQATAEPASDSTGYWVGQIKRQGIEPFNADPTSYQVFRNVKDYGATGDGTTDDTAAINNAISAGSRCGLGCDSSTTTPALVYFPAGTYLVSTPIVQFYYTQLVGDATNPPTLMASPSFQGIAVIDSDPYEAGGQNWYTNQNNFYRQIRNFVIDVQAMPSTSGTGIHWQVAQATSLQNIRFEMQRGGSNNQQQGIFMDNGSGGFMTDLIFNGGKYGAFFGNQQFTTRNLTFNQCSTAIYMNWNWVWALKSVTINDCGIGVDMSNGGASQTVGSVLIQDSTFANTPIGVVTAYTLDSVPPTAGTLVLDNVDFGSCAAAVVQGDTTVLAGNAQVASWAQGNTYRAAEGTAEISSYRTQEDLSGALKPNSLLGANGAVFERSKPQYETVPVSNFVSVKSNGAKGDGQTDDTAAIQTLLDEATPDQIVYFDHGDYVISQTIQVPKDIRITGEIWPVILASGSAFQDESNPVPVFRIGQPGDVGAVELSDLIFSTVGPQPGAILIEWNVQESSQGAAGMWDVHMRIGGAAGTSLQSNTCTKDPTTIALANPECVAAFLLLHVTSDATIYVENAWFWVADHELDLPDHSQINVFNGRGVLIEASQGPVWMYGTSAEHSQLYQYQISHASNVYLSLIQSESPYYQANPDATSPFTPSAAYSDPTFASCTTSTCRKAWGLRIIDSSDVFLYGAGLYSFFDNYDQTCLATESCQLDMVDVTLLSNLAEGADSNSTDADGDNDIYLYGLSTKAATNMVSFSLGSDDDYSTEGGGGQVGNDASTIPQSNNTNNFCSTVASLVVAKALALPVPNGK